MSKDRIRVGIIGVGWGSIVLAPAFRAVPEFEVAAICSRRPDRVAEAGQKLGIDDTSTDWEAFVRREDLDLIAVCTPTDLHHDQTIAAVRAGKHVLCEKPAAVDSAQAKNMLDVAEQSGVAHAVNFEGRWLVDRLPVWDLVDEGFLGEPYLARVTTVGDLWHPSRRLQSEWMYRVDEGGGYLMGLSSHDIDFLTALFGEPEAVCADVRTSTPIREREDGTPLEVTADDTSTVLMRMKSGVSVSVASSMIGLHVDRRVLEAYGSEGTIEITSTLMGGESASAIHAAKVGESALRDIALSDRRPRSGVAIPSRRAGSAILALSLMLEDWLPAFDGLPTPRVPTLRNGWITQAVVDAARRSSAGEGWVGLAL
ncbi:MAG TPA: Gfo/Idh/MocA family oxidoreductase [Mycobacteriales bacterium]|jgi:predicted dehydrogenase|nr:Gfo/Idh/MocA family oxidoreductase [Mycobacteriales bacterium]